MNKAYAKLHVFFHEYKKKDSFMITENDHGFE